VESEPSRWPATIGVLAIVAGAVLMAVSAGNEPPRPRVLGEMLVATTTTLPVRDVGGTGAPSTSRATAPRRATATTRPAAPAAGATTSTAEAPPSSSSTSSTPPPSNPPPTSTPTTQPCPSGAPVADVGSWDGGSESSGTWHVRAGGVVTNGTGAAVRVGPVAVTIELADGGTYAVPADERPVPDPSSVADGGAATWSWEGDVPAGAAPTGAHAAVTEWAWTDAPPGCITG
jgi:hypothetical protein